MYKKILKILKTGAKVLFTPQQSNKGLVTLEIVIPKQLLNTANITNMLLGLSFILHFIIIYAITQ